MKMVQALQAIGGPNKADKEVVKWYLVKWLLVIG
jgi:hypothetical protein